VEEPRQEVGIPRTVGDVGCIDLHRADDSRSVVAPSIYLAFMFDHFAAYINYSHRGTLGRRSLARITTGNDVDAGNIRHLADVRSNLLYQHSSQYN